MAIDWDAELLAPVMAVFGEGTSADQSTLPLYSPVVGTPFRLADAVFDRAYADVTFAADGSDATSLKPCLGVRVSLFAIDPAQNDRVFIPSVPGTFVVKDVRPDGHGHARLILMGPSA